MFFRLSRLFITALWSPAWKGLTSLLLFVTFNCVFVTFPCGILCQVRYLIVSIPDFCRLSYFEFSKVYVISTYRKLKSKIPIRFRTAVIFYEFFRLLVIS